MDARQWQRLRALLYLLGGFTAFWNLLDFQWHWQDVVILAIFSGIGWTEVCPYCRTRERTPNLLGLLLRVRCQACQDTPQPGSNTIVAR